MKITRQFLFAVLGIVTPLPAFADPAADEQEIVAVFDTLTTAWRSKNGKQWADPFIDDGDFTVWFGLELKGKEAIGSGHQFVFDDLYPDAVFEFEIRQIRFLDSDAAVVHLKGFVTPRGGTRGDRPDAVPMAVVQRTGDRWKIVAFQNTPFILPELEGSMRLGQLQDIMKDYAGKRR